METTLLLLAVFIFLGIGGFLIYEDLKPNETVDYFPIFNTLLPNYEKDGRNLEIKMKLLEIITKQQNQESKLRDSIFSASSYTEGNYPSDTMKRRMHEAFISFLQRDYHESLVFLKENPTSADAHQQTLSLGREYAAAAREGGKVTIFDETALANDIRAATANASQTQKSPDTQATPQATSNTSLKERIAALTLMKESGLLSDEEFDRKRREILDQI